MTPKLGGLSGFGGVMIVDMGPVNDRLQEQRALYPSDLPVVFPLLGGQGFGLFSRFVIGGSGAGLLSRSVDAANDRKISASGAWGTFDFGYQLLRVNGFLIAPVLSLGGYGMNVTVAPKGEVDFDEALANPNAQSLPEQQRLFDGNFPDCARRSCSARARRCPVHARATRSGCVWAGCTAFRSTAGLRTARPSPVTRRSACAAAMLALSLGAGSW